MYPHKRHVAAVGFDRDDMTLSPITYDEMRPGCYEPKARVDDMDAQPRRGVALLPDLPPLLRPDLPRGQGQGPGHGLRAGLQRLDGRGVVRRQRRRASSRSARSRCGTSRRPRPRSTATPPAGCEPCASARSRPSSACRASTRATGIRSSRRARRPAPSSACTSARRRRCRPRRPTRRPPWPPRSASTTPWRRCRDFLFSGVLVRFPTLKLAYSEGQIGWLPYMLERADDVWREHRAWGGVRRHGPRAAVDLLLPPGVRLLLPRSRTGSTSLDKVGVDNITFETDYPHTDSTWPNTKQVAEDLMGHLPEDVGRTRSAGATPSACSGWRSGR